MRVTKNFILILTILFFITNPAQADDDKKMANIVFSNGEKIKVEVMDTIFLRKQGLMNRAAESFPRDLGMLFIFQREEILSFWMRDTFIPLSIGFFDKNKKLINIETMAAQTMAAKEQNLMSYRSKSPGLYALEVNQGWFEEKKVKLGMSFEIVKPNETSQPKVSDQ